MGGVGFGAAKYEFRRGDMGCLSRYGMASKHWSMVDIYT